MRARYLVLAPILALALLPHVPASAGSTPTCLGKKATYVGTSNADFVALGGTNNVAVMKGGNDTVHAFNATDQPVYICLGDGDDEVYGDPFRLYGGSGEDMLAFQPVCGEAVGEYLRAHDVEHVSVYGCNSER